MTKHNENKLRIAEGRILGVYTGSTAAIASSAPFFISYGISYSPIFFENKSRNQTLKAFDYFYQAFNKPNNHQSSSVTEIIIIANILDPSLQTN